MIDYVIEGGSLPVVICYPKPGETLVTESGAMSSARKMRTFALAMQVQCSRRQGHVTRKQKRHRKGVFFACGAPWRIRTFDLPVRSRALYPLS